MTDEQNLLQEAAGEITHLRSQNKLMSARLGMFDDVMTILTAQLRGSSVGMSEDVVWKIQNHLNSLPKNTE